MNGIKGHETQIRHQRSAPKVIVAELDIGTGNLNLQTQVSRVGREVSYVMLSIELLR